MECNKDEAFRAKKIAERKFEQKDYAGAKKFALKAQVLYPGLDDLTQMLTTLDVYISAENKISGEVDWYGVLGVSPSSDDETVKKQYRKLALVLHPDKNKSIGAEGAFKLLSEAWSLLSDKSKRLAYNQRRSSKGFQQKQQKVPVPSGGPSAPPRNGFHNFTSRTSGSKTQKNASRMPSSSVNASSNQRSDTFWTICHRCKMHYEYLKIYLNHTLLCPNCHEAFMATETSPPFNHSKSSNSTSQWQQNLGNRAPNGNQFPIGKNASAGKTAGSAAASSNTAKYSNFQQDPFSRMGGVGSSDPSIAAKAANVVQQAHERMKRERDDSQTRQTAFKQRRLDEDGMRFGSNAPHYAERTYGFSSSKFNSTRELTPLENRNMLMGKARKEILKKLNEWRLQPQDAQKYKVKEGKKEKQRTANVLGHNVNGNVELSAMKGVKKGVNASANDAHQEDPVPESMNVPDPDFHNFDQDRSESCFEDNEVWASYDADDGMPRFYALINKVLSREPFKVRHSWLNSKTNNEFGPMEWVASGFYKTSGEFRIGRYEMGKSVNSFSHKVRWSKGPRGTVLIYPQKGDVWALYRNWSADWNQNTPDDVIHKYDMVLVLDDYNEEQGISVAPLIKVAGFKTVFRPDLNSEKVMRITREEMFRFSHQVPSHLLTGEEGQNAPKGCQELDPAATPLELLQTLTETNEMPAMQNDKEANGGSSQNVQETKTSETADHTLKSREGGMVESEGAP
ncbi:hypothetical protein KY290_018349 [Solanum tuberosum]|uniref:J domain-containing protein n=2 Tax=Solanum tuberosum TaxID=4113 RepID=A0ABQ7VFP3_SOLTU|nr:PREDICTED: uncharacterized protein LOC102583748 [Solanum tuberosum]KAH0686733.1 hypothetical protein KY284_017286 [Solanum tuberosum]KAH0762276.1 hypothetical protein KY290_018349 [Solanum tuberosum]